MQNCLISKHQKKATLDPAALIKAAQSLQFVGFSGNTALQQSGWTI